MNKRKLSEEEREFVKRVEDRFGGPGSPWAIVSRHILSVELPPYSPGESDRPRRAKLLADEYELASDMLASARMHLSLDHLDFDRAVEDYNDAVRACSFVFQGEHGLDPIIGFVPDPLGPERIVFDHPDKPIFFGVVDGQTVEALLHDMKLRAARAEARVAELEAGRSPPPLDFGRVAGEIYEDVLDKCRGVAETALRDGLVVERAVRDTEWTSGGAESARLIGAMSRQEREDGYADVQRRYGGLAGWKRLSDLHGRVVAAALAREVSGRLEGLRETQREDRDRAPSR